MECIEAIALKSSFLLKTANSNVLYNDDVWCLTGINGGGGAATAAAAAASVSDDFPVEDLLNLDFPEIEFQEENDGLSNGNSNVPSSSSSSFSGSDEFDCLSAGELTVPVEGLENLEWLSRIVDDSMSEHSMLCPAGSFPCSVNRAGGTKTGIPSIVLPVCRKPRSKRPRTNGRRWPLASPPLSAADSTSTTSSSHGSTGLPPFPSVGPVHDVEFLSVVEKPPPPNRLKRKTEADLGRRCTHCQVQRTPQWRTGPLGPKTLCNACGVRFKSGRLYPEYRPACSPTFLQEVHSNSHRKVLEMRRRKEEPGSSWAVQAQTVGSFA